MGPFAALLLTATPLAAALPGVTAVAGVQVEIVRAERVNAVGDTGGVHRNVRRSANGLTVDFE